MSGASELVRPWRGKSPEQRVAERRAQLLDAGLEVFTAKGFHAARVRDVCRQAGLTERYFYESFAGKEALLAALAEQIVGDLLEAAAPGIALVEEDLDGALDMASRAVVASLTDDPRRARILFVEVVGVSREIEDRRRAIIGGLAQVVRDAAARAFGPWVTASAETELISRAAIGAVQELLVAYVRGELPLDQEALIVNFGRVFRQAEPILGAMAGQQDIERAGSTT
ncbi:TetR/AcrR family transcriptional regulator [Patulibacter defluvii]|uniref:TetR/AcrR family transcriptional regulator n=1 Tax=Patulibacter defluvii TaxID=3095358 RepID=UPI002A747986|nr:TetR/AcrR family transcriptional regulator [Patulibacter sp. DM4]